MHKQCKCGAIESGGWPIFCQACQTFANTCYTKEYLNGEQNQDEASTQEVVIVNAKTENPSNRPSDREEVEYEVVWNGGPLLPDRDQHPDPTWQAPRGQANKNRKPPSLERDGNAGGQ